MVTQEQLTPRGWTSLTDLRASFLAVGVGHRRGREAAFSCSQRLPLTPLIEFDSAFARLSL